MSEPPHTQSLSLNYTWSSSLCSMCNLCSLTTCTHTKHWYWQEHKWSILLNAGGLCCPLLHSERHGRWPVVVMAIIEVLQPKVSSSPSC